MLIIDQHEHHFNSYQIKGDSISKKSYYQSFSDVITTIVGHKALKDIEEEHIRLIDERFFAYYQFDILLTSKAPYSISELKSLIAEKVHYIKQQDHLSSPLVMHTISHIHVNKQEQNYLLGQQGDLSFRLQLVLLKPDGVMTCSLMGGTGVFNHSHIAIYPRSWFSLDYITKHLQKQRYGLLLIQDEASQLVVVEDGRYAHMHYLNMGTSLLKSCYESHDVEKYFYTDRDEVIENQFLSRLIDESTIFFAENLCQRLQQHLESTHDIMIMGEVTRNPSFLPIFQDTYKSQSAYIMPFLPVQIPGYNYHFSQEEVHVATYLHYHPGRGTKSVGLERK